MATSRLVNNDPNIYEKLLKTYDNLGSEWQPLTKHLR